MELADLRARFLNFFTAKGYRVQPAASLIPENDPSVLFTTAGMQQFKPYYLTPEHSPAKTVTSVQPVIRTSDIAEVGDDTHLTMFEMLGNFRFGQTAARVMKETAINEAWQFINQELGVEKSRVHATVFAGDELTPADTDSAEIWQKLGVRVEPAGREDNFWGPTGTEGPCGPTSEIYIDGVEVWNLVFNQYFQDSAGTFTPLGQPGLDTGSGLERLAATLQRQTSVWQIEPFKSWVAVVDPVNEQASRIIIDHLRAIIFLTSAGVKPGNKGRDYILRRLIRKVVFLTNDSQVISKLITEIGRYYQTNYSQIAADDAATIFQEESARFTANLSNAKNYLEKWLTKNPQADQPAITELAFYMYESFGFPKELVIEHLASIGQNVDVTHFEQLFSQHQEVSRAGADKQFKGGLADDQPQTIKHHTAHHLLLAALRQVLGDSVVQRGSNVTSDRLRLDFSFDRKLTEHELEQVAMIVNQKIAENLPVVKQEMPKEQALQSGAQAEFGQKYGDTVSVYSIGPSITSGQAFSRELCGGPHVAHTGELGRFEILKEEASSQGVRRIKARLS